MPAAMETISKSPRIGWSVIQRSSTEIVVTLPATSSDAPPRKARPRARFGMTPDGGLDASVIGARGKLDAVGGRPADPTATLPREAGEGKRGSGARRGVLGDQPARIGQQRSAIEAAPAH